RIAELKAHLSQYLRAAQRGQTITVIDRDTPIACIEPLRAHPVLDTIPPTGKAGGFFKVPDTTLPPPDLDIVELLLEDRARR
ncbi:MAG TPA: hypothetical protein VFP94_06870, partial [Terriglobales bacterium]|nr:hypothetical protein [Terriglobales bacterium]